MARAPTAETSELTAEQQDRRRRLIDAAFELGADGGYDAVQMRDVAVTANVALATIYRYFSSKDHLLAAAMIEWTGRLQGRVRQSPPRERQGTRTRCVMRSSYARGRFAASFRSPHAGRPPTRRSRPRQPPTTGGPRSPRTPFSPMR